MTAVRRTAILDLDDQILQIYRKVRVDRNKIQDATTVPPPEKDKANTKVDKDDVDI